MMAALTKTPGAVWQLDILTSISTLIAFLPAVSDHGSRTRIPKPAKIPTTIQQHYIHLQPPPSSSCAPNFTLKSPRKQPFRIWYRPIIARALIIQLQPHSPSKDTNIPGTER